MTGPLISIILLTYDREEYLRQAVDSVLAQTYDRWELLIVDDGSTDGTRAYLETLTNPRIRSLLRAHCGNIALLKNIGVRDTRGSVVTFLDSDDLWLPEKLAVQIDDLLAHPDCGWSYTGYGLKNESGRNVQWPKHRPWTPHGGWILEHVVAGLGLIAVSALMLKRALFEAVGGFNESLPRCEDLDMWIRLAEASPATVVATPLVIFRHHAGNQATTRGLEELAYVDTYTQLLARTTSPRVRTLCRRERIRLSLNFVDRFRREGRYGEAWQTLWRSLPYAGWHPRWWIALLKTGFRPAIPQPLLSIYSRLVIRGDTAQQRR